MLGYRSDEMVGVRTMMFVHDAGQVVRRSEVLGIEPSFGVLTGAARRGEAETRQWTYIRKDGSRLVVQLTVTAVVDARGQQTGFVGVAVDMSERDRAEDALRTAEERFRRAFDDAPMGMAIAAATPDALGRLVDVNKAMCDLTGFSREQLLAMRLGSLADPSTGEGEIDAIGQMLGGEIDRSLMETRYITAAGDAIDVSVGLSLIRDAGGDPLRMIALIDDVSSRKRYESHLRHMADHDPLTALSNRVRMDQALDAQAARGLGTRPPARC
jgi:PAS domain S-box-containing protein